MCLRLSEGEELPFARGKINQALGEAIVRYEQQTLQNIINNPELIFNGNARERMADVLQDIQDAVGSNG